MVYYIGYEVYEKAQEWAEEHGYENVIPTYSDCPDIGFDEISMSKVCKDDLGHEWNIELTIVSGDIEYNLDILDPSQLEKALEETKRDAKSLEEFISNENDVRLYSRICDWADKNNLFPYDCKDNCFEIRSSRHNPYVYVIKFRIISKDEVHVYAYNINSMCGKPYRNREVNFMKDLRDKMFSAFKGLKLIEALDK